MSTAQVQVTACQPGICVKNISRLRLHDSKPFVLPMSISPCSPILMSFGEKPSLGLKCQPILKSRKPLGLCFAGGKGMMENNENSPWKSLTNAMEKFKGKTVEDVLRQQIQKGEYLDNGGSGSKPPGGDGGDGGSGRPDGTGGSEDESFLGIQDETLQVIIATGVLLSFYVYLINGKEILKLIKDIIKYAFGGGVSRRLRIFLRRLGTLYRRMVKKKKNKVAADEYWLEKAIMRTGTWWYDPRDFRRAIRNYYELSEPDPNGNEDVDEDA